MSTIFQYVRNRRERKRTIYIFGKKILSWFLGSHREAMRRSAHETSLIAKAIADPDGFGALDLKLACLNVPEQYLYMFYEMDAGDVCIDCGANVGKFTDVVVFSKGTSHLFEPNGTFVRLLRRKYAGLQNVVINHAAVGAGAGEMILRNNHASRNNPELAEAGSIEDTLYFSNAGGTAGGAGIIEETVAVVDLVDYIKKHFQRPSAGEKPPVYMIKIDIEGSEFSLLERMISENIHEYARYVVVETHESFFPDGNARLDRLRQTIAAGGIRNIFLDWH